MSSSLKRGFLRIWIVTAVLWIVSMAVFAAYHLGPDYPRASNVDATLLGNSIQQGATYLRYQESQSDRCTYARRVQLGQFLRADYSEQEPLKKTDSDLLAYDPLAPQPDCNYVLSEKSKNLAMHITRLILRLPQPCPSGIADYNIGSNKIHVDGCSVDLPIEVDPMALYSTLTPSISEAYSAALRRWYWSIGKQAALAIIPPILLLAFGFMIIWIAQGFKFRD